MSHSEFDPTDIEVVGLDLDNTLYVLSGAADSVILDYVYRHIQGVTGLSIEEAAERFQAYYQYGHGLSGTASLTAMGVAAEGVVHRAIEESDVASTLSADEALQAFLAELSDRYRSVDLITGSGALQVEKKLGALGVKLSQFGVIIDGDSASKSTGDAYLRWLEYYPDLEPRQFLYIGDRSQIDHVIPAAYGILTMLVNCERTDPELQCLQLPTLIAARELLV